MKDASTNITAALATGFPTMTSLEIAELTGKQHNNVLRDIRAMLEELEMMPDQFRSDIPIPGPNGGARQSTIYRLPKREVMVLVSGYNVKIRAKIVDRWQELESQVPSLPQSRIELLRLALAAEERAELARAEADKALKTIADNRLYPRVSPEAGRQHISIKDIKAQYAPYLSEPKIRLALRWYGQGRTHFQFGPHENASLTTFQREGLEEVFRMFLSEATQRVSGSGTSVIIDHECFDGETSRVPKDIAIECLGWQEGDFATASAPE
jgi:phage regulator Rha-like protein